MTTTNKLETPFGNAYLQPTSADHIFLEAGSNLNVDKEACDGGTRKGPLTVHGVALAVNAHFYRWSDGNFHIGREGESPSQVWHSLNASRLNAHSYSDRDASSAARHKLTEQLTPLVNEWAVQHPQALYQAEIDELETEVERASAKELELRTAARLASQELDSLRARLTNLKRTPVVELIASHTKGGR